MKSLPEQISTRKTWLIENKKCVAADFTPLTFFRENGELDEEKTLSAVNKYAAGKGWTESGRKVVRNNGSGFNESAVTDLDERISKHMKDTGASYRESHIFLTGNDCGRDKVQPKSFTESLAEKWRKYAPFLREDEVQQLATRGVQP